LIPDQQDHNQNQGVILLTDRRKDDKPRYIRNLLWTEVILTTQKR